MPRVPGALAGGRVAGTAALAAGAARPFSPPRAGGGSDGLSRFLIFPHVRVPQASHVLGQLARRARVDWRDHWGFELLRLETFVDPRHHAGTCYLAAGWQLLGVTSRRGLARPSQSYHSTPRQVWVKPLTSFRLLRDLDLAHIEQAHVDLVKRLIRGKSFRRYLINHCDPIAIDGSQKLAGDTSGRRNSCSAPSARTKPVTPSICSCSTDSTPTGR
ncbi:Druantia anti-phage system protein DruA [Candidatus Accumulibacter contiguus]|uniref:Druantia anti-phage system protein DruA n=1 Tax=Candidatus Accumulibacter contiguus TaxID=2954381 RepID=UPI00145EF72E|nr:Druantia anti-phage system protein DruA [Candidatus Accumulibacter contiguus]